MPAKADTPDAVPESWRAALEPVLADQASRTLGGFLEAEENTGKRIYPPRGSRLRALELTPLDGVKVVILGQDPYHGPGQAHGLAFSVQSGVRVPPSLANIYKELASDLGLERAAHGNLENWARQGVLLLNNALTVEDGRAQFSAPARTRKWAGKRSPTPPSPPSPRAKSRACSCCGAVMPRPRRCAYPA
jgi:uracil-DNA glycosylase